MKYTAIPSGSLSLDKALGIGGFPIGALSEIYGAESLGKTTLSLHTIKSAQKMGFTPAFIELEKSFSPEFAERLGVDLNYLLTIRPNSGQEALDNIKTLIASSAIDLIVVDSVASLASINELSTPLHENSQLTLSRLLATRLREIHFAAVTANVTILMLNQIRTKLHNNYANTSATPGGNALQYRSAVRVELKKQSNVKVHDETVGYKIKASVMKNRFSRPGGEGSFDLMFLDGINEARDLVNYGLETGTIYIKGSWLYLNDIKLGQGINSSIEFVENNSQNISKLIKVI